MVPFYSNIHFNPYEMTSMIKKRSKVTGLALLLLSFFVIGVSAYVYQQATMTVTQTIVEVATITVDDSVLGSINEGETISYTKATVASLGDAVTVNIQSQPVYLHFDSDLDSLSGSYSTYTITVKFIEVQGSTYSVGDTAETMTLGSPDPAAVTLDATGLWRFDFEITTTAQSVNSDTPTTATIVVSAEST
jgi:hypothetical protein